MGSTDRGQVSDTAADVYERFFVPALFAPWAEVVLGLADVRSGHRVLDVGCGTGVLARAARARVDTDGEVTGLDPNEGMLAVARRARPDIEWRRGVAERLPFRDRAFDRTISQFALMFCTDAEVALSEMSRVTAGDGRVTLAVWDRLDNNVGYARLAALVDDLFGPEAADAIRAPFHLGDEDALADLAETALSGSAVTRHHGTARFESLPAWLHTEIRGWTLADVIDDEGFAALEHAAGTHLADMAAHGPVSFDASALIVSGAPG